VLIYSTGKPDGLCSRAKARPGKRLVYRRSTKHGEMETFYYSKCEHGKQKSQCAECGTGQCVHKRRKHQCKDCGTGHCHHGRLKGKCKDCGAGYCVSADASKTQKHRQV
jgi:hypothetical protein